MNYQVVNHDTGLRDGDYTSQAGGKSALKAMRSRYRYLSWYLAKVPDSSELNDTEFHATEENTARLIALDAEAKGKHDEWEKKRASLAADLEKASTEADKKKKEKTLKDHVATKPPPGTTKVQITGEGYPKTKHHADGRGFPHFYPETYHLTRGDALQKPG